TCGTNSVTFPISVITIPSAPAAIGGGTTVCAGSVLVLSETTTGGTWSSTATSIATVDTSGNVLGLSSGAATISYTMTNICGSIARTKNITVNTTPVVAAIGGTASVCIGATTALSDATPSGTWSSSAPGVASVNSVGTVTGVTTGTATISYGVTNSCGTTYSSRLVTVNTVPAAPAAIGGTTNVCAGLAVALTDATVGGTWSSANTAIATVSSTGVVTGVAGGTVNISYTSTNSCGSTSVSVPFTVNTTPALPAVISGPSSVCIGSTITLTNDTLGGTWSSTNPGVASISSTGVVRGNSTGSTVISYTVSNSCGITARTTTITSGTIVFPAAIGGATTVCVGGTITLTDATTGGVWSSDNSAIATVNATGVVTGIMADTSVVIRYTVTNSCGSNAATRTIRTVTVPPVGAISGPVVPGALPRLVLPV
ncbi:MAG: hypothetical protein EBZ77_11545, partial [Chitinophagia bacterium]|nr:hypothetical protein [Chitinophagia bacterium]